MVACTASAILFGRSLVSGWLGALSVGGGFVIAILAFFLVGGLSITVLPDSLALSITTAISGSVIAAFTLIVNRVKTRRELLGILFGSVMSIGLAVAMVAIKDQTWLVSFVCGWVNVVFGWLVHIRRVGWRDILVWVLLIAASIVLALQLGV
jgi:hypothetical protein